MGVELQKYRTRKPLSKDARRIAIDSLQLVNYIEDGRKAPAVKNARAMVKHLEQLLKKLKKEL